jgi:hypothetical protein
MNKRQRNSLTYLIALSVKEYHGPPEVCPSFIRLELQADISLHSNNTRSSSKEAAFELDVQMDHQRISMQ